MAIVMPSWHLHARSDRVQLAPSRFLLLFSATWFSQVKNKSVTHHVREWTTTHPLQSVTQHFAQTRSYAALRAADLDWIVGPGYSSGRYILEKNQHGTMNNHENQPGPMKKQKRYERGVTTDQGRGGGAGISKNVTNAGSQLT